MRAMIDGAEVFLSGSLVMQEGQTASLFPFPDDLDFELRVRLDFDSNDESNLIEVNPIDQKGQIVTFKRRFDDGFSFSNESEIPFAISDDDKWKYTINLAFHIIGKSNSYTAVLNYTILQRLM